MNNETKQELERLKKELALYIEIAERLGFPKEEIEKQINHYLESIEKLLNPKE